MLEVALQQLEYSISAMYALRSEEKKLSLTQEVPDYHKRQRTLSVAITNAETALLWLRNVKCKCARVP